MDILLDILIVVVLVDFVSGLLHWAEDSYGCPSWPLLGKQVTIPNVVHHFRPTRFTRKSWLWSARVLVVIGAAILGLAWALDLLTWQLLLFVAIGINANEVHKWNHLPRAARPAVVALMQRFGIIQGPREHAMHHRGAKDSNYCVLTNLVNPVLEALGFWRGLEAIIGTVFGVSKRRDASINRRRRKPAMCRETGLAK